MDYKVCILTAGMGTRMGGLSDHMNKAVLPVSNKAVISHIVEKFPEDTEIVVAVGHKKDTVADYLSLAYPHRNFTYVEVDKYTGPGAGPGHSLLFCKEHLRCPFIFFTADTIVKENIPPPDHNWFGIAPVKETENYCTVKIKNDLICQLDVKIKTNNRFAFIGLAGVQNYKDFFAALERNNELVEGEVQVIDGFRALIGDKLVPIGFTWFDTGTLKNYTETNKIFSGGEDSFDFSKSDEFLYFVNGRVIKFFADDKITKNRFQRASGALKGLCPEIEGHRGHFYSYKKIDGQTLYSALNNGVVNDFFDWAKARLWSRIELDEGGHDAFAVACRDFYQHKTLKRLKTFFDKTGTVDEGGSINGVEVPSAAELLSTVDWDYITKGIPSNFHGDLQFDNVLVADNAENASGRFTLLDWRQDFGGLTHVGDLYYDLAKLYGGMTMPYPLIKAGKFSFEKNAAGAHYSFSTTSKLMDSREEYEAFLKKNNFDIKKIKLITALIFLNMSPLHNEPFGSLLYCMGRQMLHKSLTITA
jgi:choline kinase